MQFWQDSEERLSRLPGVRAVALTRWTPGVDGPNGFIDVQGLAEDNIGAGYRVVSEDYFDVLGVPIVAGRGFTATDRAGSERVVVVNEAMVREFWPDGQAIGRQVRAKSMELDGEWLTVIGVSADYRHYGFDDSPSSEMYVLMRQVPAWVAEMSILVRPESASDTPALMGAVARTIREADAELAPAISTLDSLVDNLVLQRRFVLRLLGGFAALALILAAIGLYGMLSFAVARQAREMGVRAALGAPRAGLVRLVLGRALRVLVVGAIAGLLGATALSRTIEAMLVDVAPRDLLSLAAATLILLAVGLIAAAIPAWRAARTDPIEALRSV
jgi:putative ABC transport system permease protein